MTGDDTFQDLVRDEDRLIIAGDWHGSRDWATRAITAAAQQAPEAHTLVVAGDFGIWQLNWPSFSLGIEKSLARGREAGNNLERIAVVLGNHEDWPLALRILGDSRIPVQATEHIWLLPRTYGFEMGGRRLRTVDGAASIDYEFRFPNRDWFFEEQITDAVIDEAIAGGPADLLITHETINHGTPASNAIIHSNLPGWSEQALEYSAHSRAKITRLWETGQFSTLVHGHMHAPDSIRLPDGRQVISLGRDTQPRNLIEFNLETLAWRWLDGPERPDGRPLLSWGGGDGGLGRR
jgi:hypothetical protein